MKNEILETIADYLDVDVSELEPEKSLDELGIDSLDFIEISFEIEEKLGIRFDGALPDLRKEVHCIGDVLRVAIRSAEQESPSVGEESG